MKSIFYAQLLCVWLFAAPSAWSQETPELRILSSLPEYVSGGDLLVETNAQIGRRWRIRLDETDVSSLFHPSSRRGPRRALLVGLSIGRHSINLVENSAIRQSIQVDVHPLSGPVFSGPHQEPWICQTAQSGLGPASDDDCSASTLVQYYYRSTDTPLQGVERVRAELAPHDWPLGFKPLDTAAPLPSDVATTTTTTGQVVPFIVRRETGTINRGVYRVEFLHRPGELIPSPWNAASSGWNGRLVYAFGGGCGAGYRQGTIGAIREIEAASVLSAGYAIATASLNTMANNCNYVLSAETLSMVKEHFIEQFGPPAYTIGIGFSHGAAQQFLIAQNYPGLLDGLVTGGGGSEIWMPYFQSPADCALLNHAFETSQHSWTDEQRAAVSGFASWRTCNQWMAANFIVASQCDGSLPANLVYDRRRNTTGVRCDLFNNAVNVFGRDPATGLVQRTFDNVGVQYGLAAFNSGVIDAEQFITLNQVVGGYDADAEIVAERTAASEAALRGAQESGMVLRGDGPIRDVPIIDWVNYRDDLGDGHDMLRRFSRRARFERDNGRSENQVILVFPRRDSLDLMLQENPSSLLNPAPSLVREMSAWLDAVAADNRDGSRAERVTRNRPSELFSACFAVSGERIPEATDDARSRCRELYPLHSDPRIAAGGPLSDDVLKCALRPVRRSDYRQPLTNAQFTRLQNVFPSGVCDYSGL